VLLTLGDFALRTAVRDAHREDGRSGGEGKRGIGGRFAGNEDSNVKWNGDHEQRGEFSRAERTALPVGGLPGYRLRVRTGHNLETFHYIRAQVASENETNNN
jgi:hypothetical protein